MHSSKMDALLLLHLLLALTPFLTPPVSADPPSSAGTTFVASYTREPGNKYLLVSTPESHDVDFSVSNGSTTVTYTVSSNSVRKIDLVSIFSEENKGGILISSTDGISQLVVTNLNSFTHGLRGDMYTVYPLHRYTSYTYYAISTHKPKSDMEHYSFVQIVGTENNTTVSFKPTQGLQDNNCAGALSCGAGETCTTTLQKLQHVMLCSFQDLTGTKITSDKPLAVFSGHECAQVPYDDIGNCEYLLEQIPPVVTWGKTFLVGPLWGRNTGEIYKVVSAEANTEVNVYCINETTTSEISFTLTSEGNFREFSVGNTRRCSIQANKPLLVMLLAPNEGKVTFEDGAFMSVVPPVLQYTDSMTITVPDIPESNNSITITLPVESCYNSQCSILVNDEYTIDVATRAQPIHCSTHKVCGYALSLTNLSAGTHTLKLSTIGMAVVYYALNRYTGYGTVGGLSLIPVSTVNRPEVAISRDVEDPLLVGSSLMLTCSVSTMGEVGEVIARWLRGDRGEEISSVVLHSEDDDPYELELNFEALSLEDSGIYTCGARLSSNQLATGSQTININVIAYGYIQLLIVGVTKCSEWVLADTEEKVSELTEIFVNSIRQSCNCDFSSDYIINPSLQCPSVNPESSNEVLYRTRIEGPISYNDVVAHFEEVKSTTFVYKGISLSIDKECSVSIDSLQEPPACFVNSSSDESNMSVIIAAVVGSCVVVLLLGLTLLIVVGVVTNHRRGISNQRPKSIHLHQKLMHGGDSVTSFSPESGSTSPNIYIQNESNLSSPTTTHTSLSISPLHTSSQNGAINQHVDVSQNGGICQNGAIGMNGVYSQNGVYCQHGAINQHVDVSQNGAIGMNGVYRQNGAISQNGVYHHKRVGSQNGVNAENTVTDQTWAISQNGVHSHQGVVSDNAVSCQNWVNRDLANSLNGTEGQNENQDGVGSQYGVYSINGTGSSHGEEEEEQNYVTMKTDLSILPISDV